MAPEQGGGAAQDGPLQTHDTPSCGLTPVDLALRLRVCYT